VWLQVVGLIGWVVLCLGVGAIGGIASASAADFYAQLARPAWSPPVWLFGPVWTFLYLSMAVSAWLVWRTGSKLVTFALALFVIQLSINALWSWLFFAWRLGAWSFADIVLLWLAIAFTIACFWRISRFAAVLLIPYLLWVTFASALNWTLWQLNPSVLQ
jgi:tryptophan-rich sensory protein